MPRFVRPSWVEVSHDYLKKTFGTGPNSISGSMDVEFKIRDQGDVSESIKVECRVYHTGDGIEKSHIIVYDEHGREVYRHTTLMDAPPKPKAEKPPHVPIKVKRAALKKAFNLPAAEK